MKYLDSSAFVKHYRANEVGEIISVFDKWTRYKYISNEECEELTKIFLREIKELNDSGILVLEHVSTSTITNCLDLITKHHLSLNDSIHLFTALGNKTLINQFICSDYMLIKAAKKEGFFVINPEE